MSTSFTVISLVIYALICVAQKNEWTRIYFDPMVSQGDWVCHEEDADAACVFGWTASPKTTCVDGVCTRLTGDSWIEMPFPLATLCNGVSCAGLPLRLTVYVGSTGHDKNGDGCSIYDSYDSDKWHSQWECGFA
eukprot:161766_1